MLLRSSSAPILNSWIPPSSSSSSPSSPHNKNNSDPLSNLNYKQQIPRTRSFSLTTSSKLNPSSPDRQATDPQLISQPKPVCNSNGTRPPRTHKTNTSHFPLPPRTRTLYHHSSSESERRSHGKDDWGRSKLGLEDGSGYSDGYGSTSGGIESTEAYYQRMIEANPGNSLLLGNYAKFLKEVRDVAKAEEYCERAILASPAVDGDVLSLYADILWKTQRDAGRAEAYFKQAVTASPDDCYVHASYARFLWDAEERSSGQQEKLETILTPESLLLVLLAPVRGTFHVISWNP